MSSEAQAREVEAEVEKREESGTASDVSGETAEAIMEWLRARMDDDKVLQLGMLRDHDIALPFLIDLVHQGAKVWKQPLPKNAVTHYRIKTFLSRFNMHDKTANPNAETIHKGTERPYCWPLWTYTHPPVNDLGKEPPFHKGRIQALLSDKRGKGRKNDFIRSEFAEAVRRTGVKLPAEDQKEISFEIPSLKNKEPKE